MHAASQTAAGTIPFSHQLCHDFLDCASPAQVLTVITVACDHCILPRQRCLNACHDGFLAIVPAEKKSGKRVSTRSV